jgi:hypothetical protein
VVAVPEWRSSLAFSKLDFCMKLICVDQWWEAGYVTWGKQGVTLQRACEKELNYWDKIKIGFCAVHTQTNWVRLERPIHTPPPRARRDPSLRTSNTKIQLNFVCFVVRRNNGVLKFCCVLVGN